MAGIGPKTALKLIQENGAIDACRERAPNEEATMWKKVAAARPDALGQLDVLRPLFPEPVVENDVILEWGKLDREGVLQMMVGNHRFLPERVESSLTKLVAGPMYKRQKSISDSIYRSNGAASG